MYIPCVRTHSAGRPILTLKDNYESAQQQKPQTKALHSGGSADTKRLVPVCDVFTILPSAVLLSPSLDLPPPPEPPPCIPQGPGRIQGARSVGSVGAPSERKASSLERQPMSGPLAGQEEPKARSTLDHHHLHHRQPSDRLGGSMERAEDGRRGLKTGMEEGGGDLVQGGGRAVCRLLQVSGSTRSLFLLEVPQTLRNIETLS